jgi:hypothetical protein
MTLRRRKKITSTAKIGLSQYCRSHFGASIPRRLAHHTAARCGWAASHEPLSPSIGYRLRPAPNADSFSSRFTGYRPSGRSEAPLAPSPASAGFSFGTHCHPATCLPEQAPLPPCRLFETMTPPSPAGFLFDWSLTNGSSGGPLVHGTPLNRPTADRDQGIKAHQDDDFPKHRSLPTCSLYRACIRVCERSTRLETDPTDNRAFETPSPPFGTCSEAALSWEPISRARSKFIQRSLKFRLCFVTAGCNFRFVRSPFYFSAPLRRGHFF